MDARFIKLTTTLRGYLIGRQYFTSLDAMEFMLEWQGGVDQLRDDDVTREAQHPIEVAHICRALPGLIYHEDTIASALLHDVPEDYRMVKHTDVSARFGPRIGTAVQLLDKHGKDPAAQFVALSEDPIGSIVKGVDRMANNHTMHLVRSAKRMQFKIDETRTHILPMLKAARRRFPQQEAAYELIKFTLETQCSLYDSLIKALTTQHGQATTAKICSTEAAQ